MDDVIERMAGAAWSAEPGAGSSWSHQSKGVQAAYKHMIRAALRAVRDSHRLVPVEPTGRQWDASMKANPGFHSLYEASIKAAPDYTEAK